MNDSLDDYDFTPTPSSNLASLFGSSPVTLDNSSLIYTAPKQPKAVVQAEVKYENCKPESTVISACVVQVWKLVDNKYIAIGKHGLAVIGSAVQNTYELILYREKRNIIVRIKISPSFELSFKKDDFASFYDGLKENWLIKFSNENDLMMIQERITNLGGKVLTTMEKTTVSENVTENIKQPNVKPTEDTLDDIENPENKAKADILSRIARMGQSILPNTTLESADTNELAGESDRSPTIITKSEPIEKLIPPPTVSNVVQVPRHTQDIPNPALINQTITYDPFNLYLVENRAHNTEVRLNLSQISEKLNHVLKLVDIEKPASENNEALKSRIKVLNLKIENLSREIKTYQEENTRLKLRVAQQQEMLIAEEQSEMELKRLHEQISRNRNFEEINNYKSSVNNLTEIVEKQKNEIDQLKMQLESCDNDTKIKDEVGKLNDAIYDLKSKLNKYEEQEVQTKMREQENRERMAGFNSSLKELMNEMYSNIIENFNEDTNYRSSEISSIIAQNIKSNTLKIIQNFQQISKPDYDIQ